MWLSIQGIYEYDPSVFDGLESPTYTDENGTLHTLNREDVINNILLQCAELEVVYPSPKMMKFAIGVWSASNIDAWNKLYKTQKINYNPIWNVDANETENETINRDISRTQDGTNTEEVAGYNSEDWANASKNTLDNDETVSDDNTRINTKRRTGNIGVTATQDLIKKEREIGEFSIIEFITQSFKERFCLLVY